MKIHSPAAGVLGAAGNARAAGGGIPRRPLLAHAGDPRGRRLGDPVCEGETTPAAAKGVLKTMEGVNWQAAPEPKVPRPRKR